MASNEICIVNILHKIRVSHAYFNEATLRRFLFNNLKYVILIFITLSMNNDKHSKPEIEFSVEFKDQPLIEFIMKVERPSCPSCLTKALSFFSEMDEFDLISLSNNKTCNFYKKGHIVFYEGRIPTGIYCLEQGRVKIYRVGMDGKEQIVRLSTQGSLLGIRSLLNGERYTASAATLEDSVICFVNKSFFFHLTEKYPKMNTEIVGYLCKMLKEAEDKIISIAQKPVRERLAESLLILNRVFKPNGKTVIKHNISLPREDLANIVGTATETVIRLLHDFKDENLISIDGRSITLTDIKGLKQTAKNFE
ncbi:MAG: Crp/Fnr family transcriptional regulator [Prolixibacteraceae bacterium]|jgi:CRP/FNR family transcriptional regulator, polysaccharide utilization system transcription regulator|nr:Crp/Fnr family transcriptional regulator [Prolixibacteraceae bacterium]MBT6999653.1 Crp/Fnr family transcriptional regulator [Prolixibacteraceae bacterium]MBT7394990.1 Crp/Fnr family transcriptional regulator [Prolixibacteraceae bacterium]